MEAGFLVTILFLSFASLIHGIAGVGFGMIAMSLFSITLGDFGESVAVVGLLALVVYFLLFLASTRRAKIDWSMVLIITTGGVAGLYSLCLLPVVFLLDSISTRERMSRRMPSRLCR